MLVAFSLPEVRRSHSAAPRVRLVMRGEESLGLERRHAAHSGGGHRLAVDVVGDVAGRKHAGHRGRGRVRRGHDVAGRLHLELALEELGRRRVADGDEHAVDRHLGDRAGLDVAQPTPLTLSGLSSPSTSSSTRVPDHRRSSDSRTAGPAGSSRRGNCRGGAPP